MHQYPLLPIRSKPGWFRCRRCTREFSERHPTETSASKECKPFKLSDCKR